MTTENATAFEGWAILELMGHRKLGCHVREATIAGAGFLRVDVPGVNGTVATQYYPPGSVYCLTPVTEEVARAYAQRSQPEPVTRWELPAPTVADRLADDDGDAPEPMCAYCHTFPCQCDEE